MHRREAGRKSASQPPTSEDKGARCGKGALRSGTPFIVTMKRCHDEPGSRPLTIQDRRGPLAKSNCTRSKIVDHPGDLSQLGNEHIQFCGFVVQLANPGTQLAHVADEVAVGIN